MLLCVSFSVSWLMQLWGQVKVFTFLGHFFWTWSYLHQTSEQRRPSVWSFSRDLKLKGDRDLTETILAVCQKPAIFKWYNHKMKCQVLTVQPIHHCSFVELSCLKLVRKPSGIDAEVLIIVFTFQKSQGLWSPRNPNTAELLTDLNIEKQTKTSNKKWNIHDHREFRLPNPIWATHSADMTWVKQVLKDLHTEVIPRAKMPRGGSWEDVWHGPTNLGCSLEMFFFHLSLY